MKHTLYSCMCVIMCLVLLIMLPSCSVYDPPPIRSLPPYESKILFESGEFQDYTDYGKYIYQSLNDETFLHSKYFTKITANDVETILKHIEHFSKLAIYCGNKNDIRTLRAHYDFKERDVQEGDWYYLESQNEWHDGDIIFYNYTLYYFDMNAQTLYYFHHNI